MDRLITTTIIWTIFTILFVNSQVAKRTPVDELCLQCICEAATGCQTSKCDEQGCGLFRITQRYWREAGKLTRSQDEDQKSEMAYSNCVSNLNCSKRTVESYMTKNGRDCNDDGQIDCYDYAAIHELTENTCSNAEWEGEKFNRISDCLVKIEKNWIR